MPRIPTEDMALITSRPTLNVRHRMKGVNGMTANAVSAVNVETQGAIQKMSWSACAG